MYWFPRYRMITKLRLKKKGGLWMVKLKKGMLMLQMQSRRKSRKKR